MNDEARDVEMPTVRLRRATVESDVRLGKKSSSNLEDAVADDLPDANRRHSLDSMPTQISTETMAESDGQQLLSRFTTLSLSHDDENDDDHDRIPSFMKRGNRRGIKGFFFSRLGMFLVGMSAFSFSIMSVLVKVANREISLPEIVMFRAGISAMLVTLLIFVGKVKEPLGSPTERPWLIARAIVGTLSMVTGFYALTHMILADASVLIFTSPVVTFLLAAVLLQEPIRFQDVACTMLCLCGVLMVTRPTFLFGEASVVKTSSRSSNYSKENTLSGVVSALSCACFQAMEFIAVRKLEKTNYLVVINYFMVMAALAAFIVAAGTHKITGVFSHSFRTTAAAVASGVAGFFGQIFVTKGFQLEEAGRGSVLRYLDVLFIFIWEGLLLHEHINRWSYIGALVIIAGAVIITLSKKSSTT